jgi:hypothetical protein
MISWLIGVVTGMIYDFIGIAAWLKPEDEARRLKASWALSLGVWNSGGADEYYLDELDRFFKEDKTVLDTLERACRSNPLPYLSSAREPMSSRVGRINNLMRSLHARGGAAVLKREAGPVHEIPFVARGS